MKGITFCLLVLLCFGLLISPVSSYPGAPPGDWMVVNGVLTNGTYNTTDLTKTWDHSRKFHVVASDIVFVYNDGVSDKYQGDTGLKYAMFNDTLTGCYFHIDKNLTRGIAYATNKIFNIQNFSFGCFRYYGNMYDPPEDFYEIHDNITLDNGTVIESLSIDQDLTPNQKLYFDDYETQLYKYYEDKKIDELEDNTRAIYEAEDDAYDSYVRYHESQKNKPKYSTYYGTNGYGIIRSY